MSDCGDVSAGVPQYRGERERERERDGLLPKCIGGGGFIKIKQSQVRGGFASLLNSLAGNTLI